MAKKATPANTNVGHNSESMAAEDRRALFFNHYRPIASALETLREAQAAYKKLRKEAKAEGIPLWEIDYALKCAEVDDETIIPNRIKREAEIAAWFALPIEFQPDMFGDFGREPIEERAAREGRKAGAIGVGGNPYDENSVPGKAWASAWSDEQKAAQEAMQRDMERRNAELIQSAGDPFEGAAQVAAE